jgi:hypothetical protein
VVGVLPRSKISLKPLIFELYAEGSEQPSMLYQASNRLSAVESELASRTDFYTKFFWWIRTISVRLALRVDPVSVCTPLF